MSRSKRMIRGMALLSLLPLLASGEAAAQTLGYLTLGTWEGSLGANYGLGHDRVISGAAPAIAFAQQNTNEQLSIRNSGFSVLDPGLLTGSLGLTLGLGQNSSSSQDTLTSARSRVLGYSFDADILNVLPYGGALFANRAQGIAMQPFGRVETISSNLGATMRLNEGSPLRDMGYPYLSANLRLEQQHLEELSTSALNQSFRQSELRNTLSHEGHNGYESADLDWHYEFDDVQEPATKNGSFRSQNANLGYSLDFGPTLNRRWDSRLAYFSRVGSTSMSLFSLSERLHVGHQSNLSTDYGYQLSRLETQLGQSLNQSGSFSAQYQPYQNLGSYASLQRQEQPSGQIDSLAGGLNYKYQHSLPWQGKLLLSANGGYRLTDTHINATQAMVNDEAQAAPPALGAGAGFLLNQAFVVATSIVVVDTRGGARWRVPDSDYELVPEGNLTRIVPLLTSEVIRAGDPLEVSYTYSIPPSLKYGTATRSASAGMNFGWISFSVSHNESGVTLLSGNDSRFLQSSRNDSAQVDLRGDWRTLQGSAGAAYLRSNATGLANITITSSTQQRYYQSTTYQFARNLGFAFNTDWTLSNYQLPARQSDARGANLSADWYTPGGWVVNAQVGRRYLTDSAQPKETVSNESLRAQIKYGKLMLTSSFTANQRIRGGSQLSNWRADLSVTRSL